jgi:hypothetical protein
MGTVTGASLRAKPTFLFHFLFFKTSTSGYHLLSPVYHGRFAKQSAFWGRKLTYYEMFHVEHFRLMHRSAFNFAVAERKSAAI